MNTMKHSSSQVEALTGVVRQGAKIAGGRALADGNDVQNNEDLNYVFDPAALPQIYVKVSESEWNRLVALYDRNYRNEEYARATFYWKKGDEAIQTIEDIGIRVSGNTNRRRPQGRDIHDIRPFNFKVDFNEFVDDENHDFHNLKGIKFKASGDDPTQVRDVFALDFLQRFGVWTAPRSSFARVQMEIDRGNGNIIKRYIGVYRMSENVAKPFLTKRFTKKNSGGDLWKGGLSPQTEKWGRPDFLPFANPGKIGEEFIHPTDKSKSYRPAYALKRHKKHDEAEAKQQLVVFIDNLNKLNGQEFVEWIRAHMDVSLFLKTMAVDVALGQTDGYWANTNNFNFYFNEDGILYYIPMDYDNALGTTPSALIGDGGRGNWREFTKLGNSRVPLIGKLMGYSIFLAEYKGYLLSLANDGFLDHEKKREIIIGYHRLIGDHVGNPTGQHGYIADETAWWSATPWYRLIDGDYHNNFFRAKQRYIRQNVESSTPLDGTILYVRGLDGWGAKQALRFRKADGEHRYSVSVDLEAGDYSFKIADANWSTATDFGAYPDHEPLTLSIPYGMAQKARVSSVNNMSLRIPEDGTYSFTVDTADHTKPYLHHG